MSSYSSHAFPRPLPNIEVAPEEALRLVESHSGLTMRDWHATHAPITMKEAWSIWSNSRTHPMESLLGTEKERVPFLKWFAGLRYEYADIMLREASGAN